MKLLTRRPRPNTMRRKGSVLLYSIILISLAGASTVSWLGYVTTAQRASVRDRARLYAFYSAESGVEQIVDWFNNPDNFVAAVDDFPVPNDYDDEATSPYGLEHPGLHPGDYSLFEPYILGYDTNSYGDPVDKDGLPVLDGNGNLVSGAEPVITQWTYFQDELAGSNVQVSLTSKIPTTTWEFSDAVDVQDLDLPPSVLQILDGQARLAYVTKLQLVHPSDFQDELPTDTRVITKVVATGTTGERRGNINVTVEMLLTMNPTLNLASPGAIVSRTGVEFAGQYNVHWGDLIAHQDIELPPNFWTNGNGNSITNQTEDPWFRVRTEGWLRDEHDNYADGRECTGYATTAPASDEVQYEMPYYMADLCANCAEKSVDKKKPTPGGGGAPGGGSNCSSPPDYENLLQNQNINWPEYDYGEWKKFFLMAGLPYYFTDSDGTIYGIEKDPSSSDYGQMVGKDWAGWFGIEPDDPNYNNFDEKFAFIDTIPTDANGNPGPKDEHGVPVIDSTYFSRPPMGDGSNMSTIQEGGGGVHSRGAMLVAANLTFVGQGNPPGYDEILDEDGVEYVTRPDGSSPTNDEAKQFKISHNGLLYTWGQIDCKGNRTVYGSVFADRGYGSNGGPDVWYDYRMKDGRWMDINQSIVRRTLWEIRQSTGEEAVDEEAAG
ncbi:hypothetical protein KQI84_05655 [bacterium]|nr:hypothetical protein [bacterium]